MAVATSLLMPGPGDAQGRTAPDPLPKVQEYPSDTGSTLAVFWSGDGGWADLTRQVSGTLADHGIAVIGIDSRAWLTARARDPDAAAATTTMLLRHYLTLWHKSRIVLVGYSRGAGFLPFIATRLDPDLRHATEALALLGIEHTASFEFHLLDLIRSTPRPTDIAVLPELSRVTVPRVICVYGTQEEDTICPGLSDASVVRHAIAGDHHFDRDYRGLGKYLVLQIGQAIPGRGSSHGP
ncbi:MAG: hypothetical protein IBJ03_16220 [Gemmatimonadaceae bacterium]|nr:hypothetical protein [Gemmatimonadaceae bacterium]